MSRPCVFRGLVQKNRFLCHPSWEHFQRANVKPSEGDALTRAWRTCDTRAFPGILHFLLSQPSPRDSTNQFFPCLQPSPTLTIGGRKKRRFSAELPSTVKVCPKDTHYKLIHNALQRNLWRLWKQKHQNHCMRARGEDRVLVFNIRFRLRYPKKGEEFPPLHILSFFASQSVGHDARQLNTNCTKRVGKKKNKTSEMTAKTSEIFQKTSEIFRKTSEKIWKNSEFFS